MSDAVVGFGTFFERWNGYSWEEISEIISINGPNLKKDFIDVTTLGSLNGYREFISGLKEGGTVSLKMNFTRHTYSVMKDDFENTESGNYQIILPDHDATTIEFEGMVAEIPMTIPLDDKISIDVTIKITGGITLNSGPVLPNVLPTIILTSPSNGQNFTYGASITLAATASDSDGSIVRVDFYNGATKLGQDTSSPYTYIWTNPTLGEFAITAVAIDNRGGTTTSNLSTIYVNPGVPESSDVFVPESSDLFIPESSDFIPAESSDITLIPPTAGTIAIIAPTIISATVYDIDLRCKYVEVQYKVHTDFTWIISTTEIDKTDNKVYLFGLLAGTSYDVRFKCKGFNTIPDSAYSTILTEITSDYAGTVYYIDPSAGTNGSGTIGSPFNGSTFDQLYGQPWANNTIYLIKRGTTWNRTWTINIISKHDITIAAYGTGSKPKITAGFTNNTDSLMDLGSSYNIRLCNLDMYGRSYDRATEVGPLCIIKMNGTSGTGSNTTDILNCDIHHANWGIRGVQDVDTVRVLGGTIHTTLDDGVFYQGATNCEFGYLNVYNVNEKWFQGMNQVHSGGDCIQVDGHLIGLDGLYIHHCILDHQSTGLKFCLIYEAVKLGDVVTIEYCHFLRENMSANDSEQGIYAAGQAGATHTLYFRHNIISNATAIAYWDTLGHVNSEFIDNIFVNTDRALELYSTSGVKIYNNTFVNAHMCIEHENHATGVEIKNNIFDIETGQSICNFHAGSVTPAGITIDYNCYRREVTNMFTQFLTGYSTLSAWRTFTGQESHSFVADPKLNADFSLQWNSPCQGSGQVIAGYTPTSNVDMGAFDGINYEESLY